MGADSLGPAARMEVCRMSEIAIIIAVTTGVVVIVLLLLLRRRLTRVSVDALPGASP
jgi:hypothetical protein